MADERLQQLRRAWDEGDLEAKVRLLRERMRAGELSEERVRLAAWLGDTAARLSLSGTVPAAPKGLLGMVRGLPGFPRTDAEAFARVQESDGVTPLFWQVGARLGIAAARLSRARSGEPDPITAAEEWVLCPCGAHRKAAARATTHVVGEYSRTLRVEQILAHAADLARQPRGVEGLWRSLDQARREAGSKALREALVAELVPWALGLRDPVAERVASRKAADLR